LAFYPERVEDIIVDGEPVKKKAPKEE